jgi:hypothetical protein
VMWRNNQLKRFGGPAINQSLKLCRQLNRQLAGCELTQRCRAAITSPNI